MKEMFAHLENNLQEDPAFSTPPMCFRQKLSKKNQSGQCPGYLKWGLPVNSKKDPHPLSPQCLLCILFKGIDNESLVKLVNSLKIETIFNENIKTN